MLAWLANTPNAFIDAIYRAGLDVSFSNTGSSGMNILRTIGSMPIYLLKVDLPSRAITLTKSVSSSGINLVKSPPLIRFLSIWISKVGRELLLVMSWLGSSLLPTTRTFWRILRADCNEPFLSLAFISPGVIWRTEIKRSRSAGSCLSWVAPTSSTDCFSNRCHVSSAIRGE